jgi:hypothetical protein
LLISLTPYRGLKHIFVIGEAWANITILWRSHANLFAWSRCFENSHNRLDSSARKRIIELDEAVRNINLTKALLKMVLKVLRLDVNRLIQLITSWSLSLSIRENNLSPLIETLRTIVPDISQQESSESLHFNSCTELKRRALQVFQCRMMLKAVDMLGKKALTVVDIGDSAGTHMMYLKKLAEGTCSFNTLSINLDPRAIEKILKKGLPAMRVRAEDIDFKDTPVDLFTSFEMVEHLHDPTTFFRRLAQSSNGKYLLLTVPYLRESRVGLYHIRHGLNRPVFAEDVHIFELDPEDWSLLIRHSGWKIIYQKIYYQYPRRIPLINWGLSAFWRMTDFEGFWGAILERDPTFSDQYQDWPGNL